MIYWAIGCCLLGLSAPGSEQLLDAFNYSNAESAQAVWRATAERGGNVSVRVAQDGGRSVLELPTPFASQAEISRVYMDRDLAQNLAAAGELQLDVLSMSPDSGARLSLYFRSGSGWYAAGASIAGAGWKTYQFSKAAFSIEGEPAGWHKIDGVRIAVWRGQPRDSAIRVRNLASTQHDVALVIPGGSSQGESRSARETAQEVGEMLSELGLGSDAIEETALAHDALGARQVAILAYNPRLATESIGALVEFVQRGGKLVVCYQLPAPIGAALGFTQPEYHRPDNSGQLAEIRFSADDIPGLPATLRQDSWNITTAKPAGHHARVIAEWFDADGRPTGFPAMLLSDRGAFFSHIILRDDREKKKQMLSAILGHLAPSLWTQMADNALAQRGRIGHLQDREDLLAFLKKSSHAEVRTLCESADKLMSQASEYQAKGQYAQVVELAGRIRSELTRAYLLAQPSKVVEGRAIWNHSGTGAYPGDWERTARELTDAGFNMVMPNMLWGGRAHYPSNVLPRSRTFEQYGDQIAQCVAAAKRVGLQVHVWKVNWNLSGAPRAFVEKIHREGRNQVSVDGAAHDWLCPSNPQNFQLELDSMLEVARMYDVDGLHFDYIRYPDRDKCYCDGCRARFEEQLGRRVKDWPRDCYSGALRREYADWRCDQITRLVKAVHDKAKELRPEIEISAAVFGAYPSCRASVAQDWPQWIKAGYLDFVCPMDYTQNDEAFADLVSNQLRLVEGRIPVYPGIGQWRLTDDRTVGQIDIARQLGAPGFTIFNLDSESIESAVPAIGLGVGRTRASTPHRKQPK